MYENAVPVTAEAVQFDGAVESMVKIPIQSAKFKKDIVVYFAIILFFLIIAAELFLAVWLPWHLKIDSMWADQVARRELIERFDRLRTQTRKAAASMPKPAASEAAMIQKSLDRATGYLNRYGDQLTPEQCRIFSECLTKLQGHYGSLDAKKAYSAEIPLDAGKFLRQLRGVEP